MENAIEFARRNGATHLEATAFRDYVEAAVAAEREACANACELQAVGHRDGFGNHCAAIIRERSGVI